MKELIEVFRMTEISKKARIRLIKKLGNAINMTMGGNFTEELVIELVLLLDPENDIVKDSHYSNFLDS